MKKRIPSASCLLIVCVVLGNTIQAQTIIKGTLLGQDGRPMQKSLVLMAVGSAREKTIIIQPDETGRFRYETGEKGLHFLNFVGVNHLQQKAVIYVNEPEQVVLNVRLDAPDYKEDLSRAEFMSSNGKSRFNHRRLEQLPDGKLGTILLTDEPFEYLIIKATQSGEAVTGTNAKEYSIQYPYGGTFADVYALEKPVNGKITIILDPEKSDPPATQRSPFHDDDALHAHLTAIAGQINTWNATAPASDVMELLWNQIKQEKDPNLRPALWLKYLHTVYSHVQAGGASDMIDTVKLSQALDELRPASPYWMLQWLDPAEFIQSMIRATGNEAHYEDYTERSVESWPYEVRGDGFSFLIRKAEERGHADEADRLYEKLQRSSPQSEAGRFEKLRRERKAAAKVVKGSYVPPFQAYSLEDTSVVYTPDNISAKFYLIDFWATWCGPCYREFPYLHQAYEQFHHKGFEILSFSVDSNKEPIFRSRRAKFPMPWLHAIDPQLQTIDSEMAKQFEVMGIPSAFLVDQSGKIIATTEDLRGEKLIHVLNELLEDEK